MKALVRSLMRLGKIYKAFDKKNKTLKDMAYETCGLSGL